MPDDNIMMEGGKVLAGAAILLIFFTMLSMMSPSTYPMADEEPREPSLVEKIKNFLISFPYNFCVGGTLVIVSIVASYYSKQPAIAGDVLRTLGPFQGYIFGFGIVLIFVPFL